VFFMDGVGHGPPTGKFGASRKRRAFSTRSMKLFENPRPFEALTHRRLLAVLGAIRIAFRCYPIG
jgi:hypothetical protein